MKKILILGGSHRDIPLIKASKELGYFVTTIGNKDYYLGHKFSDKSYKIDFNNLEKIKNIIFRDNIDYIIPGSGEESYLNTVKLSHELKIGNFDKLEIANIVHNKWKFKEFCLQNNISTPKGKYYKANNIYDDLQFPLVVKPTNLSGGKGVQIVNNQEELNKSLKDAKNVSDEIFLEEYIDGKLIAYSVFLINKKVVYGFLGEDTTYLNKYLITTAYPTEVSENTLNKMKNDIENIASLLSLVDGMFHLQILIKNNIPYIIDVTRRIPGDLYPYLIEYCDNVEYCKSVIQAYTTGVIDYDFNIQHNKRFIIRHCVMPNQNGVYENIIIDEYIKNKILYKLDLLEKESIIKDYLYAQIAIIFIEANKDTALKINNLIKPIIKQKVFII